MDPVTIMAGLSIASSVTSTVTSFKKGQLERESVLNQQALRTLEANEMRRRFEYNQDLLSKKLNETNQDFLNQFGQTGSGGAGSATSTVIQESLISNMTKELERAKIEAEFDINARLREADALGAQASAMNKTGALSIASGIVGGAANAYSIYKPRG